MRLKWLAAIVVALVAAAPGGIPPLGRTFPQGLPSTRGWERIDGEIEVAEPHTLVQYEFFVNPRRQAAYEVVRYRVTPLGRGDGGAVTEKMQWDRNGRDVRRFECVAGESAARRPCRWTEMEKGTRAYLDEVPVILWVYGLHRQVLFAREAEKERAGRR